MSDKPKLEEVRLPLTEGKQEGEHMAILRLNPIMRHATTANALAASTIKLGNGAVTALDASETLQDMADKVATGDLRHVSDSLLSQAVMLGTTVTELMRRAWQNAGEYPEAFQSYMQLALKAQAQSRATLEALAKLHQPREQVVRHVHVYEGGQAVVAEEFHHHGGGTGNASIAHQSHAAIAALPGPDPLGQAMPSSSAQGKETVPNARRQRRSAARKPKRAEARAEIGGDEGSSEADARTKGQQA